MYSPALLTDGQSLVDPALLAAAGFLAGYRGSTRSGYTVGLRRWWAFCETHGLAVLEAKRPHLDLYVRSLEEAGYAPGTIALRLSIIASFYRWCLEEDVVDRNPAAHVRRPKVSRESATLGVDRDGMGRLLQVAATADPAEDALVCLLALNGLRVSEACNTRIENLDITRGHRTLLVDRKGGKTALIPLTPRTAAAITRAAAGRTEGPIVGFSRFVAHRVVARIGYAAGISGLHPHMLRHAFCTAALDAGVPFRDVQEAMSHSDPRTTARYDRNRVSLDRHAAYGVATFIAAGDVKD